MRKRDRGGSGAVITKNILRIMTFNLRVETQEDGINRFSNRVPRVLEAIERESPDLIGFQEAKNEMRAFLRTNLPQYVVLGCGRDVSYNGEGIPIAYREDQFELIEYQTKWLSDTPNNPGTRMGGDQSKYPRIYVFAKLRRIADNKTIAIINVHTDHLGEQARIFESALLIKAMKEIQADAIFLTGDFNATPDSEEIKMLTAENGLNLMDLSANLSGSFHNYGRRVPASKIDYIFSTSSCVECHLVEDHPVNGVYISDHNPIVASVCV